MGFYRAKNCLTLFLSVLPVFCEGLSQPGCLGADGQIYAPGDLMPSSNPCEVDCMCKGSDQRECNIMDCARPPCENPIHIEGQCCPLCGGCDKDGVNYNTGDEMPNAYPCETNCFCAEDGQRMCAMMSCLACEHPIYEAGKCCPQCGCEQNGQFYNIGDEMQSDNPCETMCFCAEDGQRTCAMMSCLECEHPIYVVGKCCPQCGCEQNGQFYNIGEAMPSDTPCGVDCTCGENGQIQCKMIACARPNCESPIVPKGQCCPVCGCTVQGKLFEIGHIVNNDPCHPCTCQKNGDTTCENIICSKLTCKYNVVPNGECCPVCQCRQGAKYYLSGEIVKNVTCNPLVCQSNGNIKAEPVQCPNQQLQCVDPVIPIGTCCPECKNGRTCAHEKLIIKYGEDKMVGNKICRCGGDPWFPNAFCAERKISEQLLKRFGQYLADYHP